MWFNVRKKNSFSSHISRKHGASSSSRLTCISDSHRIEPEESESDLHLELILNDDTDPVDVNTEYDTFDVQEHSNFREGFLRNLGLFYLKLQSKCFIPASTVQLIVEELTEISVLERSHISWTLKNKLSSFSIDRNLFQEIDNVILNENLFRGVHSDVFRTDHSRKAFYKKHFAYVAPVQMNLGLNKYGQKRTFQYVPIKETLKCLLSEKSVEANFKNTNSYGAKLEDFCDGSAYKSHSLFSSDQKALSIILYQDSFEVVNPLGSGKKIHKVLGVYMMLGNLHPSFRSAIDHIQLVLLCNESDLKEFGQESIFGALVEDLKDIEKNGIKINGNSVKGTLFSIVGDNLGSHGIGGFTVNFSKAAYFCRYCLIPRGSF